MNRHLRAMSLVLLAIAVSLFLYWVKCQYRIDIFKAIKWEHYLPLNFLQRKELIIDANKHELLIKEDFEQGSLSYWSGLWSRAGVGSAKIEQGGMDKSNIVSINIPTESDWSFQREELIRVYPGQSVEYKASYKSDALTYVGIILYNSGNDLVDWSYAKTGLPITSAWKNVERSFVIPSGTAYIRFRVFGSDKGFLLLDNILIKKGISS